MGDPAVNRKMLLEMMREGLTTRQEKPWANDPENALVELLKAGGSVDEMPQELVDAYVSSYDMVPQRPANDSRNDDNPLSLVTDRGPTARGREYKQEKLDIGWNDMKRKEMRRYANQLMQGQTEQQEPSVDSIVQRDGSIPPRPAPSARRAAFSMNRGG